MKLVREWRPAPATVYVVRRPRAPEIVEPEAIVEAPAPPVSETRIRVGWQRTLRDEVRGEFQSVGALVWRDDDVIAARGERRIG